jgi:hypothetical protein
MWLWQWVVQAAFTHKQVITYMAFIMLIVDVNTEIIFTSMLTAS